ncbi:MAG: hypothetical protein HDR82_08610 [Bacteroides sp.]|nr:hypothetical protein [Bacteroides sp.]
MDSVMVWSGIIITVIGWLALARQAAKAIAAKKQMDKLPQERKAMLLKRNYCRLTILIGMIVIIIGLII